MRAATAEATVVGSGPNGLAAAIVCATAGLRVTVYEAEATVGGGARTEALTLPGFRHDSCSSIYPLGAASPFFRRLRLDSHGLEWVRARYPLAHPLDAETAVVVDRSIEATAASLGEDGPEYQRLIAPLAREWEALIEETLAPPHWPRHPWVLGRFGVTAVQPAAMLVRRFRHSGTRALLAGLAAHSGESLDAPLTSATMLVLGSLAHAVGWPAARGGAQAIPDALSACLRQQGGAIVTGHPIDAFRLRPDSIALCDVAPENLVRIAGEVLPARFVRRLRQFRRTCGTFKVDWALDGPIPWRANTCWQAATVHVGGTFEEIADSEASSARGRLPERPFVIVTQPSVCDTSRAPHGRHVAWGYCHVPLGSTVDMTAAIEGQIERFAPGFRDRILARHTRGPADLMRANANLIGGDISGGRLSLARFLTRPTWRGYGTPVKGLYLCSASTPPGAGVHGMCGYWAARAALRNLGV